MNYELYKIYMSEIKPEELSLSQKAQETYLDALADWKKTKLKSLFNLSYQAEKFGKTWKDIKDYEDKLKEEIREKKAINHNNLYLWLTINPKSDVSLQNFKERVEKAANRTMFKDYLYVYEQRGDTEDSMGNGFHSHLLLKRNLDYKPCKVISNLKNSFKDMTLVDNKEIFNYHWLDDKYKKDKVEYITGLKTGLNKDSKQEMDRIWRKHEDLEVLYGNLGI